MTGSTVRGRRTGMSDLDLMIVGVRPDVSGIHQDVDVCALDAETFWRRLREGDDYVLWTLRFGWLLHDEGILHAGARYVEQIGQQPSPQRKLAQARRGLRIAGEVLASGDLPAAREQCRSALTTVARAQLIAQDVFPLAREELPGQLRAARHPDLAEALWATIHEAPGRERLRACLELGEGIVMLLGR